jgi:hypothetical protein
VKNGAPIDFDMFGKAVAEFEFSLVFADAPVSGLSYRQVQMMSKHKDPKTVIRYDHGRENLEQNAVNFLRYEEEG